MVVVAMVMGSLCRTEMQPACITIHAHYDTCGLSSRIDRTAVELLFFRTCFSFFFLFFALV